MFWNHLGHLLLTQSLLLRCNHSAELSALLAMAPGDTSIAILWGGSSPYFGVVFLLPRLTEKWNIVLLFSLSCCSPKQSYFYFFKLGDKCRSYFIFIPLNAVVKIQKTWEHSKFPNFLKSVDKILYSFWLSSVTMESRLLKMPATEEKTEMFRYFHTNLKTGKKDKL